MKTRDLLRRMIPASTALLALLAPRPAAAQSVYIQATLAAQAAMTKLTEDLADMRKESFDNKKAEEIRSRMNGPEGINTKFINAMTELKAEKQKLMVNKEKNGPQIAQLEQAERRGEAARTRLRKLQSLMADDRTMIGAAKSGFLQRAAAEASDAMKETGNAMAEVNTQLGATGGDDKPGMIEFVKIQVTSGKMRFYMNVGIDGEKEIFEGSKIRVTKFPVVIRACVQDAEKVRLDAQWGSGGATWDPKPSASGPGHHYFYAASGGSSEWTAREEYRWSAGDNSARLRSIGQRNSDDSTKKETGDLVELVPAGAIAQAVGLELSAKTVKWERKSKLPGGERKADVTPQDAAATAKLVVSFFPAGN